MRAIAKANTISRWFSLLMLLACGSILYLLTTSASAGPVSNATPTRLLPTPVTPVKASPPPQKVVVTPSPVKRCRVVERTEVWVQPGFGAYAAGHVVDGCCNCGSAVAIPAVAVFVPGQTLVSTTTKEICE